MRYNSVTLDAFCHGHEGDNTLYYKVLSSPDTSRFAFLIWNVGSSLPDFTWLLRFLGPEWNFLNHLLIVLWLTVPSSFAQQMFLVAFRCIMALQLSHHTVKQCKTLCTNYHNTTNLSRYLPQFELLWPCDICAANYHIPKYWKTFDSFL